MIKSKRVYEKPSRNDGYRILVDRLWPRRLSKEDVKVNEWLKEIAPSDELRKWFMHDPKKWGSFQKKYQRELEKKSELLNKIKQIEKERKTVTLLYSAKDENHNNANVLKKLLNIQ